MRPVILSILLTVATPYVTYTCGDVMICDIYVWWCDEFTCENDSFMCDVWQEWSAYPAWVSVLQCVAVCCSVLHCVDVWRLTRMISVSCMSHVSHVPMPCNNSRRTACISSQVSHVSHEWVMSHMNESCLTWMSHVSYEWVIPHMNESCLTWMSHVSQVLMTYNNSRRTACISSQVSHVSYEWVTSHMNKSATRCMPCGGYCHRRLLQLAVSFASHRRRVAQWAVSFAHTATHC